MTTRICRLVAAVALVLAATGCAGTNTVKTTEIRNPRTVMVLHGSDGSPGTWDEMLSAACEADAVLIGESHGHPVGLPAAAALWEDILARAERPALALEFFDRGMQARMDDYLTGLTDEATFKLKTARNASGYPDGHRAMLEAAKAKDRPVVASNSPQTYGRLARSEGYDRLAALTVEQRRLFRVPDELPTGRYRDDFEKVMNSMPDTGHGGPPETDEAKKKARIEAIFRSQSLWDWTMADSVASRIREGNRPVVQVVGRFHVEFEGGLGFALAKLRPGTRVVTIVFMDAEAPTFTEEERGRADFVIYVGPMAEAQG